VGVVGSPDEPDAQNPPHRAVSAVAAHHVVRPLGPYPLAAFHGQLDAIVVLAHPHHLGTSHNLDPECAGAGLQQPFGARLG
jgi:hypothetical protein